MAPPVTERRGVAQGEHEPSFGASPPRSPALARARLELSGFVTFSRHTPHLCQCCSAPWLARGEATPRPPPSEGPPFTSPGSRRRKATPAVQLPLSRGFKQRSFFSPSRACVPHPPPWGCGIGGPPRPLAAPGLRRGGRAAAAFRAGGRGERASLSPVAAVGDGGCGGGGAPRRATTPPPPPYQSLLACAIADRSRWRFFLFCTLLSSGADLRGGLGGMSGGGVGASRARAHGGATRAAAFPLAPPRPPPPIFPPRRSPRVYICTRRYRSRCGIGCRLVGDGGRAVVCYPCIFLCVLLCLFG